MKIDIVSKFSPSKISDRINLRRIPTVNLMKFEGDDNEILNSIIIFLLFRVSHIIGVTIPLSKFYITICVYKSKSDKPYWYDDSTKIIYLYKDFNENILAHELCHAILDITFNGKMEKRTQEILCIYADKHLRDRRV